MMALQRQQQLIQAAFNSSQPATSLLVAPGHGQLLAPQQSISSQPQIHQQLYTTGMPFSMHPQQNSSMVANSLQAQTSGQSSVQQFYSQQPSSQQTFYIQQPMMPPLQQSQSSSNTTTTIQIIQQQQQQQLPSSQPQLEEMNATMQSISSGGRASLAAEADTCQRVPSIATSSMPPRESPLKPRDTINNQLENERLLKEREEAEVRERKEHDEREKQRIQEELKRRKESARELAESINEKLKNFPEPVHFACCHTLSKISTFLPFPSECASTASTLPCFDVNRIPAALSNADQNLSQYLARVLAEVEGPSKQIMLQHEDEEMSKLDGGELLTPLLGSVLTFNAQAFNTDPSSSSSVHHSCQLDNADMEQAFDDKEIQEMVDQVSAGQDMFSQFLQNRIEGEEGQPTQPKRSQHQRDTAMAAVGKQPKTGPARRKRDMVESLYDSLTGYFDPAKSRRSRAARAVYSEDDGSENENRKDEEQQGSSRAVTTHAKGDNEDDELMMDVGRFFDKRSRKRARASFSEENRPPTPTEIIQQREKEWSERQRQRDEKYRRRQQESTEDYWNNEAMAESESYCKFTNLIDQIFDQVEDLDIRDSEWPPLRRV
jgi:hypothetical protein